MFPYFWETELEIAVTNFKWGSLGVVLEISLEYSYL